MYLLKIFKFIISALVCCPVAHAVESKQELERYPITLNDWSFVVEKVESKSGDVEQSSVNGWILKSKTKSGQASIKYGFVYGNPLSIQKIKSNYSVSTDSKLFGFRNRNNLKNMNSQGLITSPYLSNATDITNLEVGPSQKLAKTLAMSALLKKLVITPDEFIKKNQFSETKPYIENLMKVATIAPPSEVKIIGRLSVNIDGVKFNISGYFRIAHNVQQYYQAYFVAEDARDYDKKIKSNYKILCVQKNDKSAFIQDFCKRIDFDEAMLQAINKSDYSKLQKIISDKQFINATRINYILEKGFELKNIHLLNFIVNSNLISGDQSSSLKSMSVQTIRYKYKQPINIQTQFKDYYDGLSKISKIKLPKGVTRRIEMFDGNDSSNPWCKLPKPDPTQAQKFEVPDGWQKIKYNNLSFYLPEDFEKQYPKEHQGLYSHEYISDDGTKLVPMLGLNNVASPQFIKRAKKISINGQGVFGILGEGNGYSYGGIYFSKADMSLVDYKNSDLELGLMMSSKNKCFENLVFQISKTIQFHTDSPKTINESKPRAEWQKYTLKNCCTFFAPKDFELQKQVEQRSDCGVGRDNSKSESLYFKNKNDETQLYIQNSNHAVLNAIYKLEFVDFVIDQRKAKCVSTEVTGKFSGCYFQSIKFENNITKDQSDLPKMLSIELHGQSKVNDEFFQGIIETIKFTEK